MHVNHLLDVMTTANMRRRAAAAATTAEAAHGRQTNPAGGREPQQASVTSSWDIFNVTRHNPPPISSIARAQLLSIIHPASTKPFSSPGCCSSDECPSAAAAPATPVATVPWHLPLLLLLLLWLTDSPMVLLLLQLPKWMSFLLLPQGQQQPVC
jgi:hypothetical protein